MGWETGFLCQVSTLTLKIIRETRRIGFSGISVSWLLRIFNSTVCDRTLTAAQGRCGGQCRTLQSNYIDRVKANQRQLSENPRVSSCYQLTTAQGRCGGQCRTLQSNYIDRVNSQPGTTFLQPQSIQLLPTDCSSWCWFHISVFLTHSDRPME